MNFLLLYPNKTSSFTLPITRVGVGGYSFSAFLTSRKGVILRPFLPFLRVNFDEVNFGDNIEF